MELLVEILLEIYGELMFLVIPEKAMNKKYVIITKVICALVFLCCIALVFWGVILIFDYNDLFGIVPISIAVVISLTHIIELL